MGRLLLVAVIFAAGCVSQPTSTRLTHDDFDHVVGQILAQLEKSDWIAARTPQSERVTVVIDKVQNLTSDVIPPAEQWMLMARIRSGLSVAAMRQRNIIFQIAPERHALLQKSGFRDDLGPVDPPSHRMTATFRSSTRAAGGREKLVEARTDLYFLECNIDEIQSRQTLWSGGVEFKRAASGLAID